MAWISDPAPARRQETHSDLSSEGRPPQARGRRNDEHHYVTHERHKRHRFCVGFAGGRLPGSDRDISLGFASTGCRSKNSVSCLNFTRPPEMLSTMTPTRPAVLRPGRLRPGGRRGCVRQRGGAVGRRWRGTGGRRVGRSEVQRLLRSCLADLDPAVSPQWYGDRAHNGRAQTQSPRCLLS